MTPAESALVSLEWNEGFAKIVDEIFCLVASDHSPKKRDDSPPTELNSLKDATVDQGKLDVTKIMVGAFQGTAGQNIVDGVYNMANTTNDLNLRFERAYRLLLKIDSNKYARKDGSIVEYAETWRKYHKTFQQLITESKDIASTGKCYTERYAQEVPEKLEKLRIIIEDPRTETETLEETRKRANKTIQLIEASINLLLKDMADTERRAQGLGTKLSQLSTDVKRLSEELGQDIDCLPNRVNIDLAIKSAEGHIKTVVTLLGGLNVLVALLLQVAVGCAIGGGIGWLAGAKCTWRIVSMLGYGARDLLGVLTAVAGCGALGTLGLAKVSEIGLMIANWNLESQKRKKAALDQSKTDVIAIQTEVDGIVSHLGMMMKIWNSIQSDAVQLKEWLKGCLNPDVPVEDVARNLSESKIGLIYSILGQVLQTYATEVNVNTLKPLNT